MEAPERQIRVKPYNWAVGWLSSTGIVDNIAPGFVDSPVTDE
jgi:hypothetical protein